MKELENFHFETIKVARQWSLRAAKTNYERLIGSFIKIDGANQHLNLLIMIVLTLYYVNFQKYTKMQRI